VGSVDAWQRCDNWEWLSRRNGELAEFDVYLFCMLVYVLFVPALYVRTDCNEGFEYFLGFT